MPMFCVKFTSDEYFVHNFDPQNSCGVVRMLVAAGPLQ